MKKQSILKLYTLIFTMILMISATTIAAFAATGSVGTYVGDEETSTTKTKDKDAEIKDKDAETKDEDAETKDNDAETKDKDAETKDKDAETKDKDAETKDKNAETKDEDAETKDKDAETKDKDAETKDKDAETKVVEATNTDVPMTDTDASAVVKKPNTSKGTNTGMDANTSNKNTETIKTGEFNILPIIIGLVIVTIGAGSGYMIYTKKKK